MKRIIKFFIFKILELAGAFVVWSIMSFYGHWICLWLVSDYDPLYWVDRWVIAPTFGVALGCVLPGIIFLLLYAWFKWNWDKAGE